MLGSPRRWILPGTLALLASTTVAMTLAPAARAASGLLSVGEVLRVSVPEAFGGKTVIGQLTVDRAQASGFVTAFPCEGGLPGKDDGGVTRSDLNFDGTISPVASNRLIVEADDQGDVCFYTSSPVAMIVDVNAVSFDGGITSITNRRTDTRAA